MFASRTDIYIMNAVLIVAILFIVLTSAFFYFAGRKNGSNYIVPAGMEKMLLGNVSFYRELDEQQRSEFAARVKDFLATVAIRGIETSVEDIDRVLVGAGAVIPIFGFPGWRYRNISEVLLYKGTFNKQFETDGKNRNVLGMVGDGAMHRVMILSQPSLRSSFQRPTDGHNTVIHEFVHLIDKADGAVDGVPEYLLARPYLLPWIREMREQVAIMKTKGRSDIDMYGASSDAEFLAIVSEYFFEKPGHLKDRHPELYDLLAHMFHVPDVSAP